MFNISTEHGVEELEMAFLYIENITIDCDLNRQIITDVYNTSDSANITTEQSDSPKAKKKDSGRQVSKTAKENRLSKSDNKLFCLCCLEVFKVYFHTSFHLLIEFVF